MPQCLSDMALTALAALVFLSSPRATFGMHSLFLRALAYSCAAPTPRAAKTHNLLTPAPLSYVGVLHEINSDESTVSLENVRSFGTEGRKGRPDDEVGPSDQVYEYIVFRGSDVKDLRIEDHPGIKESKPPAVPDDPAIVGVSAPCLAFQHTQTITCPSMMKYSGCKPLLSYRERKTMWKFPLPSF